MAGTGNEGAFQRALARFQSHLDPAQKQEFSVTSLQDVQETISRIQNVQGSERKMRNFNRIKAFLEAMEQFGKAVEVFLNVSEIIAFVWGLIKFLLQIASTWFESFDVLLDAYEEISENLPQLLEYGELFEKHAHMRKVLEMMYGDILEFHRRALKFFSRPAWKHLFHSSWKTFKTQFQYILSSLSRHKHLVESQANLVEYEESRKARLAAETNFEEVAKAERLRRFLTVTQKIHPPNTLNDHEGAVEARQQYPESGSWILRHPSLRDWMDFESSNVPLLWINGIPGAGKSVIASLIIEALKNVDSIHLGFFYCKYNDHHKSSFTNVLSCILIQLVQQNDELLPYMYDACCSSNEVTINTPNLLKQLVETSLRSCPNTCIVIDGIDECEEGEEKRIIEWFLSTLKNVTKDNAETMRLLFISQRDKVTENLLTQAAVIALETKDHQEDIQRYALDWALKIQTKFGIPDISARQIGINVANQAQGLFLFAKLVSTNLHSQTTREKLSRELQPDSFPTDLEMAYERIALSIFENPNLSEREDAHNIFKWIICAKRPLKWNDIQSIFAIDPVLRKVDFDERQLRVTCRDLCGSLVETGVGDTLELVHRSAKISGDLYIADFCLDYLNFGCFDANLADSDIGTFFRQGYYSFEDYAIAHWLEHVDSSTEQPLPREAVYFRRLTQSLETFLTKHMPQSPPDVPGPIEVRFQSIRGWSFGKQLDYLMHLARQRQSNEGYSDLETQLQRRRFIYEGMFADANLHSNSSQAEWLHNQSKPFKCPKTWCEFFHDGFQDQEHRNEHVNQHARPFRCSFEECLYAKLGYGTEKDLKRHERKSHPTDQSSEWAFPKTHKPEKSFKIFSASQKGDVATVKRLVEQGVDPKEKLKPGLQGYVTPLYRAVQYNHLDVVAYLLKQGCNGDSVTIRNLALRSASVSIVQLLFENIKEPDKRRWAADFGINYAVRNGREELIPLFLTYGVNLNEDKLGRSLLRMARCWEHDACVQALLDNGAQDEPPKPERHPTPTPPTPRSPFSPTSFPKDSGNTDILENFDFEQFLATEGDFNFGPSTFDTDDGVETTTKANPTSESKETSNSNGLE